MADPIIPDYTVDPEDITYPRDDKAMGYTLAEIRALKNRTNILDTELTDYNTFQDNEAANAHAILQSQVTALAMYNATQDTAITTNTNDLAYAFTLIDAYSQDTNTNTAWRQGTAQPRFAEMENVPDWSPDVETGLTDAVDLFASSKGVLAHLDALLNLLFPVGHILTTTSALTPTQMGYPGNWGLLAQDVHLRQVPIGENAGVYYGSNTTYIEPDQLPNHDHEHSFELTDGGHQHTVSTESKGVGRAVGSGSSVNVQSETSIQTKVVNSSNNTSNISLSGSIGANGSDHDPIDLRGRYYAINMYRRNS